MSADACDVYVDKSARLLGCLALFRLGVNLLAGIFSHFSKGCAIMRSGLTAAC